MVLLLATGVVPPAVAGLLAAGAIVVSGVLSPAQAYRAISWTTVVLVGGMIPLSTAFTATGTADLIANGLLSVVGDSSPTLALTALVVLTMVLGQLISNTATVLIMAPIGYVASPWLLDLVNAAPAVKAEALPFLRIMFLFSWGMLLFFMLGGALRSAGDARTPLRLCARRVVMRSSTGVPNFSDKSKP